MYFGVPISCFGRYSEDVYKRQVIRGAVLWISAVSATFFKNFSGSYALGTVLCLDAVSYTHLDVYKRQDVRLS